MIEDIRDWVMSTDTPLTVMWHGERILEFGNGVHFYRMLDTCNTSVAPIEGFERWGPSTKYYMEELPYSKESLMRLVGICEYLTKNMVIPEGIDIGPLDIGAVYEIDGTGLQRLEVLDRVGKHIQSEASSWLPFGVEVRLEDIESLVDIVMGEVPAITTDII